MNRRMRVIWRELEVGSLESDNDGRMTFRYTDAWKRNPEAFPLSLSLPLDDDTVAAEMGHRWFANLLPEGPARDALCRSLGVSPENDAALLARIGRDCAGAVQVIDDDDKTDHPGNGYEPVSDETLRRLSASRIPYRLAAGEGLIRLSLAGAQDKWPVKWDGRRFFLPRGNEASTHIVKFPRQGYPTLATNEAWMARLAGVLSLPAAECRVYGAWLIVTRFDRREEDGGTVQRLHQEDYCQALGISPKTKYQEEGGPDLGDIAAVIRRHHSHPASDLALLVRWQIFNQLCGNADGHAKNLSRFPNRDGGRLTPFYDLVCTALYSDLSPRLAMGIGRKFDPGQVRGTDWDIMAGEMGLKGGLIRRELEKTASALEDGMNDEAESFLKDSPDADPATIERINTIIRKRIRRTRALLQQ